MADDERDDTLSFQEATMTVEDRHVHANRERHDTQQGLRSGWKSERVSGNEIRERLSALMTPSSSAAATDTSEGLSAPLQVPRVSGPPHDNQSWGGAAHPSSTEANFGTGTLRHGRAALEDRSGDINTGVSVESWGGLLGAHSLSKAEVSLDLNEAEKLFDASPINAKHVAQPLGLVSRSPLSTLDGACSAQSRL